MILVSLSLLWRQPKGAASLFLSLTKRGLPGPRIEASARGLRSFWDFRIQERPVSVCCGAVCDPLRDAIPVLLWDAGVAFNALFGHLREFAAIFP